MKIIKSRHLLPLRGLFAEQIMGGASARSAVGPNMAEASQRASDSIIKNSRSQKITPIRGDKKDLYYENAELHNFPKFVYNLPILVNGY